LKRTVAAGAAEQVFVAGPPRPRARRVSPVRSRVRALRAARGVLVEAQLAGDPRLIERARRSLGELDSRPRAPR
jgi:hypothetical protein